MKWVFIACIFASFYAEAKQHRSHAAKSEFKRQHPCPATGGHRGACKNFIIDHRIALCTAKTSEERKQLDMASNMRWMTITKAKAKDRWECKAGWEDRLAECEAKGCFVE